MTRVGGEAMQCVRSPPHTWGGGGGLTLALSRCSNTPLCWGVLSNFPLGETVPPEGGRREEGKEWIDEGGEMGSEPTEGRWAGGETERCR